MEGLSRSLNYQQPFQTELNFDKYAQKILENGKPTATTAATVTKISNFLQEFGATFINSIQLQNFQKTLHQTTNRSTTALLPQSQSSNNIPLNTNLSAHNTSTSTGTTGDMEIEFVPNQIIIDSSSFNAMDELQKQLEYDKFMNEVWIGIVLTLILISMIFCICSCFLYHQFRTWKRNYHSTVVQSHATDLESMKLEPHLDDPVPEYTLVSGLPSYEAALELMQKTPKSCLIVYPSVLNVFNKNETTTNNTISSTMQQQQHVIDLTTPLLTPASTIGQMSNKSTNLTTTLNNYTEMENNNQDTGSTTIDAITTTTTPVSEKELLGLLDCTVTERNNNTKPFNETLLMKTDKSS